MFGFIGIEANPETPSVEGEQTLSLNPWAHQMEAMCASSSGDDPSGLAADQTKPRKQKANTVTKR